MMYTDQKRAVEMLGALVNTPSPTGDEGAISMVLASLMEEAGYDQVTVDENHNVVGLIDSGQSGPTVLLLNHSDSAAKIPQKQGDLYQVHPGERFGRAGDCVSGPGAASPKSATTAILLAGEQLIKNKHQFKGRVKIAIVSKDLFCNHDGTREAAPLINDAQIAITAEPSNNEIITCARGIVQFKITLHGQPNHWAVADQRHNAFYQVSRLIDLLGQEPVTNDARFGLTGFNPVKITYSATAPNLPQAVELIVDRRLLPEENVGAVIARMKELVGELERQFPEYPADFQIISNMYPFQTAGQGKELAMFSAVAEQALGRPVRQVPIKCATNAAYINEKLNIPALVFGCGDLADMAGEEFIELKALLEAAAVYYTFVLKYCSLSE